MRIDEIIETLIPGIAARVFKPNEEVLQSILANGWTQASAVAPKRHCEPYTSAQYELRV